MIQARFKEVAAAAAAFVFLHQFGWMELVVLLS
jgi:hypothetical protein